MPSCQPDQTSAVKVVVFESEPREAPVFERFRPAHDLSLVAEPLGTANVDRYSDAEAISTFIYSNVNREVLERLPALQLIATRSTGYDHIDLDYCAERGITVANVPTLIGAVQFARMKDGVVLINTARGSLIDARALIQGLRSGKVAAAGLDVLPDEPLIREEAELICSIFCDGHDLRNLVADHILLYMPNVDVTPHSAFNTREAVGRIVETTVANIEAFAAGHPQNVLAAAGAGWGP
jgi:lactate dehydrogenase-like 2-hydroxyacid dehydrogenase